MGIAGQIFLNSFGIYLLTQGIRYSAVIGKAKKQIHENRRNFAFIAYISQILTISRLFLSPHFVSRRQNFVEKIDFHNIFLIAARLNRTYLAN